MVWWVGTPFQPKHHGQLEHIDDPSWNRYGHVLVGGLSTAPDRSQLPQLGPRSVGRRASRESISLNAQGLLHVLWYKTARRGIHEMAFVCRHPNVSDGWRAENTGGATSTSTSGTGRRRRHPGFCATVRRAEYLCSILVFEDMILSDMKIVSFWLRLWRTGGFLW